ncbi:MAG: phosphoribosylamine--glycine ligase [Bacteroidales bacterium]
MKILIIGRWGKTHALAKALAKSRDAELYSFMDRNNSGIAELSAGYRIGDITDIPAIEKYVQEEGIEMILVVPEMSLQQEVTTYFNNKGIPSIGPSEFCARLETDKGFTRKLMKENNIDGSPGFKVFFDKREAVYFIRNYPGPVAVKPAGVTSGDGVKVMGIQLADKDDAVAYAEEIFDKAIGGIPSVIIEEKIEGEEYTIQMLSDGKTVLTMPAVRDYKLLEEGDAGLNTPGMGSCSYPDHLLPFLSRENFDKSVEMVEKILDVLREKHGEKYKGFLSGQYMLTRDGIKLVEINVRPGDSEILNITPILKTDFLEICKALAEERLDEIEPEFENKATVCKYVVPEGFPTPSGHFKLKIDHDCLNKTGAHLFQSCFEVQENVFEPSPRLFALTGVGDCLESAYDQCEKAISCIKGDKIFHRKDIGTPELASQYEKYKLLPDEEL